jgi:hypothetical protein
MQLLGQLFGESRGDADANESRVTATPWRVESFIMGVRKCKGTNAAPKKAAKGVSRRVRIDAIQEKRICRMTGEIRWWGWWSEEEEKRRERKRSIVF